MGTDHLAFTPETDFVVPPPGAQLHRFTIDDVVAGEVRHFTVTIDNPLEALRGVLNFGPVNLSGTIVVRFEDPKLLAEIRVGHRALRNKILRAARPHMGKRAFYRLRGRMRAGA